MTPVELDKIGESLFGQNFKPQLAAALGVRLRRVQEWCSGAAPIPDGVAADVQKLAIKRRRTLRDMTDDPAARE